MARSLRGRLIFPVVGLVGLMGFSLLLVMANAMEQTGSRLARARARDLTLVVAASLKAPLEFDDAKGAEDVIETLRAAGGIGYARVLDAAGVSIAEKIFDVRAPKETVLAGQVIDRGEWIHASMPIPLADGARPGAVTIGFSRALELGEVRAAQTTVTGFITGVVLLGALSAFLIGRRVARPIEDLTRIASEIVSTGDLRRDVAIVGGSEEIWALSLAFAELVDVQRRSIAGVARLATELDTVSRRVDEAGRNVSRESASIEREVVAATTTVETVRTALHVGEVRIGDMLQAAERTSDSLLALTEENNRAAEGLRNLSVSSQETARMVQTLTVSSERTAERTAAGDAALRRASTAMQRVAITLTDIERSASETRAVSLRVRDGARTGRGVLNDAQQGVDRMRGSMDSVDAAMQRLGERVGQIQLAAQVIDEVADQTALLSLNATIVAAQVGEKGRAFTVVASSIKALSRRTRASAATIVAMITELNGQADAAAAAVRAGRIAVEEGASRSRDAGMALETILSDTALATERLESIASITTSQTDAVREVGAALEHMVNAMADIRTAGFAQAATTTQLQGSTQTLADHANTVDGALAELGSRSQSAFTALREMQDVVRRAGTSQQEQAATLARVLSSVEAIAAAGVGQRVPIIALVDAISAVRAQATEIQGEAARFKI